MAVRRMKLLLSVVILLSLLLPAYALAGNDSWTTTGPYVRVRSIVPAAPNSSILFFAGQGGVYRSTNSGLTWETPSPLAANESSALSIAISPSNPTHLVAAGSRGIYLSEDSGSTWRYVYDSCAGNLECLWPTSVAADPLDARVFYAISIDGYLLKSTDSGFTWTKIGSLGASPGVSPNVLLVHPGGSSAIYVGCSDGVYTTLDDGISWKRSLAGWWVNGLTARADNPEIMYAAASSLFVSDNGGLTWALVGPAGQSVICAVPDPLALGTVWLGTEYGVFRSQDNGQTWSLFDTGMGTRWVNSMYVNSRSPQTVYAGTDNVGVWQYTITGQPTDYSVSINGGALYTNSINVTLNLTAPAGTTEMMVSNDGGFSGANWEGFAAQKNWTITSYGSYIIPRTVYVRFKTNGQTSATYQDDIVLDVTAPTGSVKVVDASSSAAMSQRGALGAQEARMVVYLPLMGRAAHPGMKTVRLSLSASDDISGVDGVLVANEASFYGAQWQAYAESLPWWVPPSGSTTVYVRFRDRAGNISSIYSDVYTPG